MTFAYPMRQRNAMNTNYKWLKVAKAATTKYVLIALSSSDNKI